MQTFYVVTTMLLSIVDTLSKEKKRLDSNHVGDSDDDANETWWRGAMGFQVFWGR